MRADDRAVEALDAGLRVPHRDVGRDVALLPLRGGGGPGAVVRDHGDGHVVALLGHELGRDLLDELGRLGRDGGRHLVHAGRSRGDLDLEDGVARRVDALPVLLDDVHALLGVGLLGVFLELGDGLVLGQDAGDLEERGLEHGVGARAHAGRFGDLGGVDHVELDLLVDDLLFDFVRQVLPDLFGGVGRSEQERRARLGLREHVVLLDEGEVVARDEVRVGAEVRAADGRRAEAQVGGGEAARLLGVVLEVALRVVVRVGADDLDRVLVGADRAVGAEAVEHALLAVVVGEDEGGVVVDRSAGDVVLDADGEVVLRGGGGGVLEDALHHRGRELLGAEAVAAADDLGPGLDPALLHRFADRGADVEVERVAEGAGLLDAVEDRDDLGRGRERLGEGFDREREEEADLEHAVLAAGGVEFGDSFVARVGAGAHDDDHVLGVGRADVIDDVVLAAGELRELVHVLLDDARDGGVVLVDRLAALEVDVGVLGRAAHLRVVWRKAALAEGFDEIVVDHRADGFLRHGVDLLHFMGGAEAVEEVEERDLGFERRSVGDEREVLRFLHGSGGEHREARLAAGHDVRVVAEDVEALVREGAGGHVEDRRRELARDLVHVGDHQQEALRRRERRREGAGRERAVDRAGGAALGLHLDDLGDVAPEIGLALGGEFVARLRHRGGGGDRVDRADFAALEGDLRARSVAVHHDFLGFVGHGSVGVVGPPGGGRR